MIENMTAEQIANEQAEIAAWQLRADHEARIEAEILADIDAFHAA